MNQKSIFSNNQQDGSADTRYPKTTKIPNENTKLKKIKFVTIFIFENTILLAFCHCTVTAERERGRERGGLGNGVLLITRPNHYHGRKHARQSAAKQASSLDLLVCSTSLCCHNIFVKAKSI
jgi:hypothetical protein